MHVQLHRKSDFMGAPAAWPWASARPTFVSYISQRRPEQGFLEDGDPTAGR